MRLSVACNFDDALLDGLKGQPVYEIYGKVSRDKTGGGRPSFYLPQVDRSRVEATVKRAHGMGIEFNYLLNASCMANAEYTRDGQRAMRETLDWVSSIGVDSVTVGHILLLQLIKRCYPSLKVRISAHRFTDSPRKARFWEDHGADCIVLNETAFHREFAVLAAIREAVSCDLSLIVNNSCRIDCAIAGTHATSLSHGSQSATRNRVPLDYHMLFCLDYRLREPVNYVRANWIRPEDLHHYEAIGYDNFKIVERNTPTPSLLRRVRAYANRRYDGNLFDLVLPFQYAESDYTSAASREAYSLRRAMKYFFKPGQVNVAKVPKLSVLGRKMGLLYPMQQAEPPLYLDNRKLDGFLDRFLKKGCTDLDCETCKYCHRWADDALTIDPEYRRDVLATYQDLFDDMHTGSFFEQVRAGDVVDGARLAAKAARRAVKRVLGKPTNGSDVPVQQAQPKAAGGGLDDLAPGGAALNH